MRIVMVVVAFLALLSAPAGARSDTYVVDPGLITTTIPGPVTVIVTGNPFRFPWTLVVNGQTVSPTVPFTSLGSPMPSAAAATGVRVLANGTILVDNLSIPGTPSPAAGRCTDMMALAHVTTCAAELEARVSAVIGAAPNDVGRSAGGAYRTVRDAQSEFTALQNRTDAVLAAQAANLGSETTRPAAVRAFRCLLGADPEKVLDCDKDREIPNRATVASVNAAIARVQPYPAEDLAAAKSDLDELRGAVRAHPVTAAGRNGLGLLNARLGAIDARLRPYLAGGTIARSYETAAAQLQTIRATVLSNVGVSRFFAVVSVRCPGLLAGRSTLVTIKRFDDITNSVTIRCPAQALFAPRP